MVSVRMDMYMGIPIVSRHICVGESVEGFTFRTLQHLRSYVRYCSIK